MSADNDWIVKTPEDADWLESLAQTLAPFDDAYWTACDREASFPERFYQAMVSGGWLGIASPEQYGGSGLGLISAVAMMQRIARCGAMSAASAVHMNIFGPRALLHHGSEHQCQAWLSAIINGEHRLCFAVTEPDTGLDTTRLKTRAKAVAGGYRVSGQKVWTSTAQVANKILLLARTADRDPADPSAGMSLFYTDFDRSAIDARVIEKMGRHGVDSNTLFIDDLHIPASDLIGTEGQGFRYLLNSLNPERILVAAEAVGIGENALQRAVDYAKERVVFDRAIGANQAIQHPLAAGWAKLHAAKLTVFDAASRYDRGQSCAVEANAAKFLAAEAGMEVCRDALAAHGGMGYAREYQIERLYREILIPYLAPVSQQLALCFVAERALGLPKSY